MKKPTPLGQVNINNANGFGAAAIDFTNKYFWTCVIAIISLIIILEMFK